MPHPSAGKLSAGRRAGDPHGSPGRVTNKARPPCHTSPAGGVDMFFPAAAQGPGATFDRRRSNG
jgi:hypothetical protein